MPMHSCDPLAAGCEDSYQYFSDTQTACSSQSSVFDHSALCVDSPSLSINTNFFDSDWTGSSSPLSSMPGTPHTYSDVSDPMAGMGASTFQPLTDGYGVGPLDFFTQSAALSGNVSYCMPQQSVQLSYGAPEFASKNEFSSMYERHAPGPMDSNSFPSAFMASSILSFIM